MRLIQKIMLDPTWPEYGISGDGTPIRLADVEALLPAGAQRSMVHFVDENGFKVWTWKEAGYYVRGHTSRTCVRRGTHDP